MPLNDHFIQMLVSSELQEDDSVNHFEDEINEQKQGQKKCTDHLYRHVKEDG